MSFPRSVFEFLKEGTLAHARWEYEVSTNILRNRKKLLILFIMLLPILLVILAEAGDILGGKTAYAPAHYSTTIFIVSIAIGIAAGLITGCIGAGGGFIITPALMAAGVKGIVAVGTDLFHIFAKAIMGTAVHKKLGNVSLGLAITSFIGSALGTVIGGTINRAAYDIDPVLSDAFISVVYAILLGFLGFYALADFLKLRKAGADVGAHGSATAATTTAMAIKLQSLKIPPMIRFDEDFVPGGRRISGLVMAGGGVIVGLMAAIMGVGGGFIAFPMFVYLFGISTMTTVGTSILQIIFTAGLAAITQYAIYGYVFYTLAMGMLLGSLIGIQVGALTTKVIKGIHIRGFFAVTILAGFVNRASVLPKKLGELEVLNVPKPLAGGIETIGFYLFWIISAIFGIWVMSKFFGNLKALREE